MDSEFLKKLLSYETSGEERDMLCEVAYGRPFSECLGEIRRDDFMLGLKDGKYKILSISSAGEKQESVEIRFMAKYGWFERPESVLYRPGERSISYETFRINGQIIPRPQAPAECYVTFYKAEIDDAMLAAFRKCFEEEYGIPFNNVLEIIKTQDKQDGGKKKKN